MNIYSFVRKSRDDYKNKTVTLADGYEFSQYETLNLIHLYNNNQFESGKFDSLGLEKAFFNVSKDKVLLEVQATDVDTKDLQVYTESPGFYTQSWMFAKENQAWMKEANMAAFLNKLVNTRARYGGTVVKKTEHSGDLKLHVVPWKNLITDQYDIENGIIIEKHYYTPAQLRKTGWKNIDKAIAGAKMNRNDERSSKKDALSHLIEVYEIHGEMPKSFIDENASDDEYSRQFHVICNVDSVGENMYGDMVEFGTSLFSAEEKENPYKYLARNPEEGRGLGRGIVEELFENQVWTNDAVNTERKVMNLASKMMFQQPKGNGTANNLITGVEIGQVLSYKKDKITQVNMVPGSLPQFNNLIDKWNGQAEKVTSSFAAAIGDDLPSGTSFKLGNMMRDNATSIFRYYREEIGIFLREIYTDWVFPHLEKKLKKEHTLLGTFGLDELKMIDESYVNHNVNSRIYEILLDGKLPDRGTLDAIKDSLRDAIQATKNKRFINIPQEYYKGFKKKLDVMITDEQRDKSAYLETLNSLLQVVATQPHILQDPVLSKLFTKIMEMSGMSSVELTQMVDPRAGQVPGVQGQEVSTKTTKDGSTPSTRR